jgi:hypothetical protein
MVRNELTPWSWVLLGKPPVAHLLKNLPKFYETWRFITVFTRAWARWNQSSNLCLRRPTGLFFFLVSPPKPCMRSCSPPCVLRALSFSSSLTWRGVQVMNLLIIQSSTWSSSSSSAVEPLVGFGSLHNLPPCISFLCFLFPFTNPHSSYVILHILEPPLPRSSPSADSKEFTASSWYSDLIYDLVAYTNINRRIWL